MIDFIRKILSCPAVVFGGIFAVSVFSLAAALTAQFVFDLEPCVLCLYQRMPFLLAAVLALVGLALRGRAVRAMVALCGLVFAVNAVIAFYHVGVEQQWWVSAVEGCAVPSGFLEGDGAPASFLDELMKAPAVPCTQVAWVDPVFGMSMAFYNILLCGGMAVVCALSAALLIKRPLPSI